MGKFVLNGGEECSMATKSDLMARYQDCLSKIEIGQVPLDASAILQALANLLRLERGMYCAALMESDPAGVEKVISCMEKLVDSSERILDLIVSHSVSIDNATAEITTLIVELKYCHSEKTICGI